jgi:hypothetical protein
MSFRPVPPPDRVDGHDESGEVPPVVQRRTPETREALGSDSESDHEHRNLYEVCNKITEELEDALAEDTSWGRTNVDITIQLQEVYMSLAHWKNSIRWSARDRISEPRMELVVRDVLKSLMY